MLPISGSGMQLKERIDSFPDRIEVGPPGKTARWLRDPDLLAAQGSVPEALAAEPAGEVPGEGLALASAAPDAAAPAAELARVTAVYRAGEGGPVGVPTGEVFVRFAAGTRAANHRSALAAAGFEIKEVPAYAPHAAWVRARSHDAAEALAGLGRLAALPGVENVEPQLLSARVWK
jgi:hypothetical protein